MEKYNYLATYKVDLNMQACDGVLSHYEEKSLLLSKNIIMTAGKYAFVNCKPLKTQIVQLSKVPLVRVATKKHFYAMTENFT